MQVSFTRKNLFVILLVLALQTSLSACTAIVIGGTAVGAYYLGKDERSIEQIADDANLTANVKSALLGNDHIKGWNINVDTYNNVVTLNGFVENNSEYELAEKITLSIKGVKSVESRLKIISVSVEEKST